MAAAALTVRDLVLRPGAFFESVGRGAALGPAIGWAMLMGVLVLVPAGAVTATMFGTADTHALAKRLLLLDAVPLLFTPLRVVFFGTVLHVLGMMTFAQRAPWRATVRAVAYMAPLGVAGLVPIAGWALQLLLYLVWSVFAVAALNGTTRLRAALPIVGVSLATGCFLSLLYLFFSFFSAPH